MAQSEQARPTGGKPSREEHERGYRPTRVNTTAVEYAVERSAYDREHGLVVDARRTARGAASVTFGWTEPATAVLRNDEAETVVRVTPVIRSSK